MNKDKQYDFSGWATKNNLKCSDGRVIMPDAFKHNDGLTVPLVWQHMYNSPNNVLGHAVLENRHEGVYAYAYLNKTEAAQNAKELVHNGDIQFFSIHANQLKQNGLNVTHGQIKEVSLVLSGANPGALIDNISFSHGDYVEVDDSEALIYTGEEVTMFHASENQNGSDKETINHAGTAVTDAEGGETMQDIFNTLNEKQKAIVIAMLASAMEHSDSGAEQEGKIKHTEINNVEGDQSDMKSNVFDQTKNNEKKKSLTHADFTTIIAAAKKHGSFRDAIIQHAETYGIDNIDYLFPDATNVNGAPVFMKRDTGWVTSVMNGIKHTPFARIKSLAADITADDARAKGYVKGELKREEIISLLKRTTSPTTLYKKQKLDRDDMVDITDFDVVAWLKAEMRMMLDEEIARAILVGDTRDPESGDKINETCIRPIWTDNDLYAHHVAIDADKTEYLDIVDAIIKARKYYKGSGNPVMYTSTDFVTELRLLKDITGRRLFLTDAELCSYLRVSKIEEVPVMDGLTRSVEQNTVKLIGIFVNLNDYVVGADKGGAINTFEDFDIDYNQQKYLIETRISGALVLPKSALVIEQQVVDEDLG